MYSPASARQVRRCLWTRTLEGLVSEGEKIACAVPLVAALMGVRRQQENPGSFQGRLLHA